MSGLVQQLSDQKANQLVVPQTEQKKAVGQDSLGLSCAVAQLQALLSQYKDGTVKGVQGSSQKPIAEAAAEMMVLLGKLQITIGKADEYVSQMNLQNGDAMIKQMQAAVQHAKDELDKIAKEEHRSHFWSIFSKIAEGVLAAVITGIAILAGQPEIAVLTIVLTTASISGGLDKAAEGVSKLFELMGVPENIAKVLGDLVVIAATIVLTVATAGVASGAAATEVEGAVTTTATVATGAAEGTEVAVDAGEGVGKGVFSRAKDFCKTHNPLSKLSKPAQLGVLAGSQVLGSSQFASDFINALPIQNEKLKEKLMIIAEVIQVLASLIGGGAAYSALAAGTAVRTALTLPRVMRAMEAGTAGMTVAQGIGEGGQADVEFRLASAEEGLGWSQAMVKFFEDLSRISDANGRDGERNAAAKLGEARQDMLDLTRTLPSAEAALARVLANSAA